MHKFSKEEIEISKSRILILHRCVEQEVVVEDLQTVCKVVRQFVRAL